MKLLIASACLACAISGSAFAADPAFTTPLPQSSQQVFFESGTPIADAKSASFAPPPPPMFDFTGLFAGGNVGYAFNSSTNFTLTGTDPFTAASIAAGNRPGFVATRANGLTVGGELGYNKEFASSFIPTINGKGGGFVLGVQADAAYTDLSSFSTTVGADGSRTVLHERTGLVGTLRARVGVAFDKLMVFGTGGLAFGSVNAAANTFTPAGVNDYSGASSSLRVGYAFGGGLEYALMVPPLLKDLKKPAVVLKVEYLHYDLGAATFSANSTTGLGNAYNVRLHNDGNIVRAAVDYKFDPADALGAAAAAQK